MRDIITVVKKELKEFWKARGSLRARLLSFLPILIVFGIYMPLQQQELWREAPFVPGAFFMALPLFLAGGTAADSFAGERERHTLETLLATRLSDRDIFVGKVLATVAYCVGVTWVAALASLVTLNLAAGGATPFLYTTSALTLLLIGSPLAALLITAIGVLVSLRAASVRAAAQIFSLALMACFIGGPLLLQALPTAWRDRVGAFLSGADWTMVGLLAGLALLLLDILLLALGSARFQRTRLILE